MKRVCLSVLLGGLVVGLAATTVRAADEKNYTRKEDVVYGRKTG